jgi:hypothetical protein
MANTKAELEDILNESDSDDESSSSSDESSPPQSDSSDSKKSLEVEAHQESTQDQSSYFVEAPSLSPPTNESS